MRIYAVTEDGLAADDPADTAGKALAGIVELHSALAPLMDFYTIDPRQVALDVGMVSPLEEDGIEDLNDIDFEPTEWFEAAAGLTMVQQAIRTLRDDPGSVARTLYDPKLRVDDVLADLEEMERALILARDRETRFQLRMAH